MSGKGDRSAPVALEYVECPLGCAAGDDLVLKGHDRINGLPGEFDVVRCRKCALMRTNPRPTPEAMGFYYPPDYGPYESTRVTATDVPDDQASWRRSIRRLMDIRAHHLPDLSPGRLLEIGCASGSFLNAMARRGWDVTGIEFSKDAAAAAAAHGFPVYAGRIEDAPAFDQSFDLVTAWMAFEHFHDPLGALRKIREWVGSDATLVLSVPNAGAKEFELFKSAWYDLHLPNHLFHYTPKTIRRVLAAAGWRVEKVHFQRTIAGSIASLGNALSDRGYERLGGRLTAFPESVSRLHDLLFPFAAMLSRLGQTGRMTVWARPSAKA